MSVIKHFAGASRPKKKGFPRRAKQMPKYPGKGSVKLPDRKAMTRGNYPETGTNEKPGAVQREAFIKVWEDRNRSNNNTKLNP